MEPNVVSRILPTIKEFIRHIYKIAHIKKIHFSIVLVTVYHIHGCLCNLANLRYESERKTCGKLTQNARMYCKNIKELQGTCSGLKRIMHN